MTSSSTARGVQLQYCFLSEPQTGDPQQESMGRSPCVDAHHADASSLRMDMRTTRSDGMVDGGKGDLGFHYAADAPFLEKSIPACLVIDFDYAYWHTNADTLEQISPQSLKSVGEVILSWISDQGD